LGNVPILLAEEMRKRFAHIIGFQKRETGFDPTYLVATFLDPNTAYLLSYAEQKLAKREMLILVSCFLFLDGGEGGIKNPSERYSMSCNNVLTCEQFWYCFQIRATAPRGCLNTRDQLMRF
jgi:hypothetical protein